MIVDPGEVGSKSIRVSLKRTSGEVLAMVDPSRHNCLWLRVFLAALSKIAILFVDAHCSQIILKLKSFKLGKQR